MIFCGISINVMTDVARNNVISFIISQNLVIDAVYYCMKCYIICLSPPSSEVAAMHAGIARTTTKI